MDLCQVPDVIMSPLSSLITHSAGVAPRTPTLQDNTAPTIRYEMLF